MNTLVLLSLGGAALTVVVGAYNCWRARREAERLAEYSEGTETADPKTQLLTEEIIRSSSPGLSETSLVRSNNKQMGLAIYKWRANECQ